MPHPITRDREEGGTTNTTGAETSPKSMQTVLLILGGLLLGGASIVLSVIAFANIGAIGRITLLALVTVFALALPIPFLNRNLTATAETLASVALLLVLLDGYVAWSLRLFGGTFISTATYFGLVCLATAIIATAYHAISQLVAPRFVTMLALQPVIPLMAYPAISDTAGWSLVFAGVAAIDLGLSAGWWRLPVLARIKTIAPAPLRAETPHATEDQPADTGLVATPPVQPTAIDLILRDVAWVLFALGYISSLIGAISALTAADDLPGALRSSILLIAVAGLGIAGGLTWWRPPMPDVLGAIAVLAIIIVVTRVGSVAMPGYTALALTAGVMLVSIFIPILPRYITRGPRMAGAAAATGSAVLLLVTAIPAIVAPLRATSPIWNTDVGTYPQRVAELAGSSSWQLIMAGILLTSSAAIMLPSSIRLDGVVIGATLTILSAPAALSLTPLVTPAVLVASAVAAVTVALNATRPHTVSTCLCCAFALYAYAAATSLTRSSTTTLILFAITIANTAIALSTRARTSEEPGSAAIRVTGSAGGYAVLALPSAVAAATATMVGDMDQSRKTPLILVASFMALTFSVGATSISQLARGRAPRPMLLGASVATAAVVLATFIAPGSTSLDILVGILMATGVTLLWLAPSIDTRQTFGPYFSGADAASAALTVAAVAAAVRAAALIAPGVGLLTGSLIVLIIAVIVQGFPANWRRGPVAGGSIAGAICGVYAGMFSIAGIVGIIRASNPIWDAQIGVKWHEVAEQYVSCGAQIPLALFFLAAAAAISLPRVAGEAASSIALALAATSATLGFGLPWFSPMIIGLCATLGLAMTAPLARSSRSAYTRLIVAGALCLETVLASLARASTTAGTLIGFAIVGIFVAWFSYMVKKSRIHDDVEDYAHIPLVGGASLATALIALPAAAATITASSQHPNNLVVMATLATTATELAVAALICQHYRVYFPYLSGGIAIAGMLTILISIAGGQTTAVYASAAALLGVLAELIRANGQHGTMPLRQLNAVRIRSDRSATAPEGNEEYRYPIPLGSGFGLGVALAAGVPAAIAIVKVAPAVMVALIAPYHWLGSPWDASHSDPSILGWFEGWTGQPSDVLSAFVLTISATLVAVGLGGDRRIIANRAVTVIIPGAAVTTLITPAALHLPYPAQPMAALAVAAFSGLGVALTPPPREAQYGSPFRIGRRFAFIIAVFAAGAGLADSLATPHQTIMALACSVIVGLIGALWGKTWLSRAVAWQVMAGSAQLLALATGLAIGLSATLCAYPLLMVSGILIGFAGFLRLWRNIPSLNREVTIIESIAYVGAGSAVMLTFGSVDHTAAICFNFGAILGLAAARPERNPSPRLTLIISAMAIQLIAFFLLLISANTVLPEIYTLPFAILTLVIGLINLRFTPETGSMVAYGPALIAGFAPTVFIVLSSDSTAARRVLLTVAAVLTVAVGAWNRQKAPVVIGAIVTAIGVLHELSLLGRFLPWPVLFGLFVTAGALLIGLGAMYEKRLSQVRRFRGALGRMR